MILYKGKDIKICCVKAIQIYFELGTNEAIMQILSEENKFKSDNPNAKIITQVNADLLISANPINTERIQRIETIDSRTSTIINSAAITAIINDNTNSISRIEELENREVVEQDDTGKDITYRIQKLEYNENITLSSVQDIIDNNNYVYQELSL